MRFQKLLICLLLLQMNVLQGQEQSRFLVTCYWAGDCNNVMLADNFIDSICEKNKIVHKYRFIGIKKSELPGFSLKIFNKYIDSSKVLSEAEAEFYKLKTLEPNHIAYVCHNNPVFSCKIGDFLQKQRLMDCETNVEFVSGTQPGPADSLDLHVLNRTLIRGFRNGNLSSYAITGNSIYAVDPMFNETICKIDKVTGTVIIQRNLLSGLSTRKIYETVYQHMFNKDSLMLMDSLYNTRKRYNIENIIVRGDAVYLSGFYKFLTYKTKEKVFFNQSHNMVLVFDTLLNFMDFYVDPYTSYSNMYPDLAHNPFFVDDSLLMAQFIYSENTVLKTKYIAYFKLKNRLLLKTSIDSIVIPENLVGNFESNVTGKMINLGTVKHPAWVMYPTPLIYFKHEHTFYDMADDSVFSDSIPAFAGKDYTFVDFARINDHLVRVAFIHKQTCHTGVLDLQNKQYIPGCKISNPGKFNLQVILSNEGRVYCFPINHAEENNFLYELKD